MKKNDVYIGLYLTDFTDLDVTLWPIVINETKKSVELLNSSYGSAKKSHKDKNWEFYLENTKQHFKVLKYEE